MNKRVVITGIGTVSPLGNNATDTWNGLLEGKSGISICSRIDVSELPAKVAAELKNFDIEQYVDRKEARRMDRFTQYAVAASKMALEDAQLEISEELGPKVGVWIGSGIGGMETFESTSRTLFERGYKRVSPFFVPMMIPDMASGQVSIYTGAKGPNGCTVTACASGTNSIGEAFKMVQRGAATAMITGGAEAPITLTAFAGFMSAKALTFNNDPETACRPFDKNRDGFVMGEGAGIVILEELEHAKQRGAKIYAEVVGYGSSGDAYHITAPAPDGEGGARSMQAALDDANISPNEVDYINAHGTSTPYNDMFETMAIKSVFKEHANHLAISSTKSMTGHLLGAAGGLEAVICALTIKEGKIPPTINIKEADEDCDLDYVPNEHRVQDVAVALSNSFGFGGHNATLVFKKCEE